MNLSIIIPVYNVEKYLFRCVKSVIDLNITNYEIIIINDGSTDGSLNVAKDLAIKHSFIRVISQDNQGLSAVRNKGIQMSRGKYILFLDSDDFYNNCDFQQLLRKMEEFDLDILQFGYELNSDGKKRNITGLYEVQIFNNKEFIENIYFTPFAVNKIIRKRFLIDIKLKFAEGRLMEDDYFSTEMFLKANRIGNINMPIYCYYQNPNSIRKIKNTEHEYKVITDLIFSIEEHKRLYSYAEQNSFSCMALEKLKVRQESILFFMIIRMLKLKVPFADIEKVKQTINLNKIKIFPKHYNASLKYAVIYKILRIIFNNKFLFRILTICNKKHSK